MNPMCILTALAGVVLACGVGCSVPIRGVETHPAGQAQKLPEPSFASKVDRSSASLLSDGRKIFRFETFGSEDFWGAQLQLHRAIASQRTGGSALESRLGKPCNALSLAKACSTGFRSGL
jgi:hypothetical protein